MSDLFDLTGKTAVVTGASGALGSAMAAGMANAGADLALCYGSSRDKAEAVRQAILKDCPNRRVEIAQVDANDPQAVAEHARQVKADFGHVDILVTCAGGNVAAALTGNGRTFFDLELEPLREVMHTNFFGGCLYPCLYYGREMAGNPQGGSIINITSMNAFRPLDGRPGYAAAKAAVSNFTLWLASHVARECNPAIRVNAIAPGFIPNDRTLASLIGPDGVPSERGGKILAHTPMGRLGTPQDLVGTCIWYASAASAFVTGTVVPVDGGFSACPGV